MAGADDVAVFDFQIRLGIGDRAWREHEVAVELIGVGARCGGFDERVADPCGVRALAAERALVDHARTAFGVVVHDHCAVFDVLARIDEIDAEHIEVAMLTTEILIHANAYDLAAEGDDRMAQRRFVAHMDAV